MSRSDVQDAVAVTPGQVGTVLACTQVVICTDFLIPLPRKTEWLVKRIFSSQTTSQYTSPVCFW